MISNETTEKGNQNKGHVFYVICIFTLKMHYGFTCQASDVTVCVSTSTPSYVVARGECEVRQSSAESLISGAKFKKVHVDFFNVLFLMFNSGFSSKKLIPSAPLVFFFLHCHCSPTFKLGLRLKDTF